MNATSPETITVNGTEYLRADLASTASTDGLQYVIVRSRDSGVHAGYLDKRNGDEVHLVNSRRIWSWDGAATLSQVAKDGIKSGKIPCAVNLIVLGVCEIIETTDKARKSIEGQPVWTA